MTPWSVSVCSLRDPCSASSFTEKTESILAKEKPQEFAKRILHIFRTVLALACKEAHPFFSVSAIAYRLLHVSGQTQHVHMHCIFFDHICQTIHYILLTFLTLVAGNEIEGIKPVTYLCVKILRHACVRNRKSGIDKGSPAQKVWTDEQRGRQSPDRPYGSTYRT